jgi:hypothetical protein
MAIKSMSSILHLASADDRKEVIYFRVSTFQVMSLDIFSLKPYHLAHASPSAKAALRRLGFGFQP